MKLFLDFDPCNECKEMIEELTSPDLLFADEKIRYDISAKFLRHITYNHNEAVKGVAKEVKAQKNSPKVRIKTCKISKILRRSYKKHFQITALH